MAKKQGNLNLPKFRINDEIYGNYDVRITGEGIESRVVPLKEAKGIAVGVRLEHPSQLIDQIQYHNKQGRGKYLPAAEYAMVTQVDEIQLSVNITEHDLQTKANNAKKFIENGNKVKATLTMKGRELSRREENKRSILEFIVMMEDVAVPEFQPRDDGNKTIVILKKK